MSEIAVVPQTTALMSEKSEGKPVSTSGLVQISFECCRMSSLCALYQYLETDKDTVLKKWRDHRLRKAQAAQNGATVASEPIAAAAAAETGNVAESE